MESEKNHQRQFILYCSLAGFISAWAISGLLVIVDVISGTPAGTFFAVIGISLGFSEPMEAQYIGFLLHVITGVIAGNIFGQLSYFGQKLRLTALRMVWSKECLLVWSYGQCCLYRLPHLEYSHGLTPLLSQRPTNIYTT